MKQSYGLFNKDQFDFDEGYLTYDLQDGKRNVFIARFKYNRNARHRFITFLKNNFTVSEYLGYLDSGMTPVAVLRSKGYEV